MKRHSVRLRPIIQFIIELRIITTEEAKDVGENVMKCDGTLSISYTTSLKKQVDHMLESLIS